VTIVNRLTSAVLTVYFWAFIFFLFAPLAVIVIFAFNQSSLPVLPITALSTQWFQRAFDDTELTGAVVRSAEIGAATGLLATALGIMASIGLTARRLRLRAVIVAILLLPLVVPYISLAVGLLILLNEMGLDISLGGVFLGHIVIVRAEPLEVDTEQVSRVCCALNDRDPEGIAGTAVRNDDQLQFLVLGTDYAEAG
jgi:spermidine/putrescine transport system permease protein